MWAVLRPLFSRRAEVAAAAGSGLWKVGDFLTELTCIPCHVGESVIAGGLSLALGLESDCVDLLLSSLSGGVFAGPIVVVEHCNDVPCTRHIFQNRLRLDFNFAGLLGRRVERRVHLGACVWRKLLARSAVG